MPLRTLAVKFRIPAVLALFSCILSLASGPARAEPPSPAPDEATTQGWTAWSSLGGGIVGDPAACTIGVWTYVFALGTDNAVWYRKRNHTNGTWAAWKRIGGYPTSSPAAVCIPHSNGTFHVEVFVRGKDGALWSISGSADNWTYWQTHGGTLDPGSGPSVAWNAVGNRLDVFVRGTNHSIFQKTRYNGSWSGYQSLGGHWMSDPASVFWSQNHLELFARGVDGYLWQRFYENGAWYPWQRHEGTQVGSAADVVSRGQGILDLFVRGTDNTLWQKTSVNGIWGSWQPLGGVLTSGPGATLYSSGKRMFVFARGTDGALWHRAWSP